MANFWKVLLVIVLCFIVVGCGSNPYEGKWKADHITIEFKNGEYKMEFKNDTPESGKYNVEVKNGGYIISTKIAGEKEDTIFFYKDGKMCYMSSPDECEYYLEKIN